MLHVSGFMLSCWMLVLCISWQNGRQHILASIQIKLTSFANLPMQSLSAILSLGRQAGSNASKQLREFAD